MRKLKNMSGQFHYKVFIQVFVILLCQIVPAKGQLHQPAGYNITVQDNKSSAYWIKTPYTGDYEPGVYIFRNIIRVLSKPEHLYVNISADNAYKLYVNGILAGLGPAVSDPENMYFERLDLASFLHKGENILGVEVWNITENPTPASMGKSAAFVFWAEKPDQSFLDTPGNWKTIKCGGVKIINRKDGLHYPSETIHGEDYPHGWCNPSYDDSNWFLPETIKKANLRGSSGSLEKALSLDPLPEQIIRSLYLAEEEGKDGTLTTTKESGQRILISKGKRKVFFFDPGRIVYGSPSLFISGGEDARISFFLSMDNLSEYLPVLGSEMKDGSGPSGGRLLIYPGKSDNLEYHGIRPIPFRYMAIVVNGGDEDLYIDSASIKIHSYKSQRLASFSSDDQHLNSNWENSCQIMDLLCSDQLPEFIGPDALQTTESARKLAVSQLYSGGDDRLVKKAILDFYHSIGFEGLTLKAYPSNEPIISPLYSLTWISMLYDYMWHAKDEQFVFDLLIPIQNILSWFEYRIDPESGMLGKLEYENFTDFNLLQGNSDASSVNTLRFIYSLNQAAELFDHFGYGEIANSYSSLSDSLKQAVLTSCWDTEKGFLADNPEMNSYSLYGQILLILSNTIEKEKFALLMDRAINAPELSELSPSYNDYLYLAMIKAGLGNKLFETGIYDQDTGPDANTAFLSYEFLAGIAGIRPADYSFKNVIINPNPGILRHIEAEVPVSDGLIQTNLDFSQNGGVKGTIILPGDISGIFLWYGQVKDLKPGKQFINIQNKIR